MQFEQLLDSDQFLVMAQLEPPKGTDTSHLLSHAEKLKGRIHAAMVPELNGAIMRMGSLGAAFTLKQSGIETIITMTKIIAPTINPTTMAIFSIIDVNVFAITASRPVFSVFAVCSSFWETPLKTF